MIEMDIEDFSRDVHSALKLAAQDELILTQDGKARFELVSLESADDEAWDEELMKDPRFIARMEHAQKQIESGQSVAFEDIKF